MTDVPKSPDECGAEKSDLGSLRTEIDRIDDAMHDLLMQRTDISRRMAAAKGARPSMRPAREIEVLRRLAARHQGEMPLAGVIRIWREIIAASLAMQMPYSVYLFGGEDERGIRDLARFHFGSAIPLHSLTTSSHVVKEVADGQSAIGILPEPLFEEDAPWWPHLLSAGPEGPRIISSLPLLENAPGYDFPKAFALTKLVQRPTGNDITLIALQAAPELRRTTAPSLFEAQGIGAHLISLAPGEGDHDRRYMLLKTDEFVAEGDPRLDAILNATDSLFQLKVVGGYARPINCAEAISD